MTDPTAPVDWPEVALAIAYARCDKHGHPGHPDWPADTHPVWERWTDGLMRCRNCYRLPDKIKNAG